MVIVSVIQVDRVVVLVDRVGHTGRQGHSLSRTGRQGHSLGHTGRQGCSLGRQALSYR